MQAIVDTVLGRLRRSSQLQDFLLRGLKDSLSRRGHIVLNFAAQGHDVVLKSDESTTMILLVKTNSVMNRGQLSRNGAQEAPQRVLARVMRREPGGLEVYAPGLNERGEITGNSLILDLAVSANVILGELGTSSRSVV